MVQRSFWGLLQNNNLPITWRVWILGILIALVFSGVYLIMPFILDQEKKGLLDLFWTVIIEIPAVFAVVYLIDKPWCGRKRIIIFGFFFTTIFLWVIWYYKRTYLVLGLVGFKFFTRTAFLAFYPLVAESYSTVYRSLGIGACQGIGRIAGAFAPAIIFPLYYRDNYQPFLLAMISELLMFIIMLTYPYDLTQLPLDIEHFSMDVIQEEYKKQVLDEKNKLDAGDIYFQKSFS